MKRSLAIASILSLSLGTTAAFARTNAVPTRAAYMARFDRVVQYSAAIFAAAQGNPVPFAVLAAAEVDENDGQNNNDGIKEVDGQNNQNGTGNNVNEGNGGNNQSGEDGQNGGGN